MTAGQDEKEKALKTTVTRLTKNEVLYHWPILEERIKELVAEIGKEQFDALVKQCDLRGVEVGMYFHLSGEHKTYLIFSSKYMKEQEEIYKKHLEK